MTNQLSFFEDEEDSVWECRECDLYKNCKSPNMPIYGQGKKKILIIGEAPGQAEDNCNIPFIGKAGQLLRKILAENDIDFELDCWSTNAVNCCPGNKPIKQKEIKACREHLQKRIENLQPDKIITLGLSPLQSLLGEDMSITTLGKWVGQCIPHFKINAHIYPTYHPTFILQHKTNIALKIFKEHIKKVKKIIEHKFRFVVSNFEGITHIDKLPPDLNNVKYMAIDIETTGLKPHSEGHKILCVAMAISEYECYVVDFHSEFFQTLCKSEKFKKIRKIAHDIKFEKTWLDYFDCDFGNWHFDTMLASHIIDNRSGICGLKHQAFINYGIFGYDKEVEKFIKSDTPNGLNKLDQVPPETLKKYCGMDALITYRLAVLQKEILKEKEGYRFFHNGKIELTKIEKNGFHINTKYYQKQNRRLEKRIVIAKENIQNDDYVTEWKKQTRKTIFNPGSAPQLKQVLFDFAKIKTEKKTARGSLSVDKEVLSDINIPLTESILKLRKYGKIKNNYLKNMVLHSEDNIVRPNYMLHTVTSYRSSCGSPNMQNVPKRDEESQKIIRSGIIPSPGNQLLEVDCSGQEVRVGACYHKDPIMIKYINNPESDMHRDIAKQIFIKDEVTKEERFIAKNGFVFAEFYGDYYVTCAKNIWKDMSTESKEHLFKNGIKTIKKFTDHLGAIEYDMWNNKFFMYKKWKDSIWNKYEETGEIKVYTGFVCRGLLTKNQVCNFPIQGSAFHCLLWSLIELNKILENYKSKIIGQIHDSIIFDIVPEELKKLKIIIREIMTEKIREHWKWIIVPLDIDAEISEIDGNWFAMKEEEI